MCRSVDTPFAILVVDTLQTLLDDVNKKIAAHEKKLRFYYNQKALIDYQIDLH